MFTGELKRAILETLAYSDVFEYPLRLDELCRYLPMRASITQTTHALALLDGQVGEREGFHFLAGREEIVEIRKQREAYSNRLFRRALLYGRMLGSLPFIRSVALTGSLAVLNSSQGADFDYMLVAASKRVWMARAFALAFNRLTRLFGHTLCPNVIVSENALAWPTHDLYSAREFCQMILITGKDLYAQLMDENMWVKEFLPNAFPDSAASPAREGKSLFKKFFEPPLNGRFGDWFEQWEMNRKVARFSKQEGFGEETIFNADVCQGNFDRHRQRTSVTLKNKLTALGIDI